MLGYPEVTILRRLPDGNLEYASTHVPYDNGSDEARMLHILKRLMKNSIYGNFLAKGGMPTQQKGSSPS